MPLPLVVMVDFGGDHLYAAFRVRRFQPLSRLSSEASLSESSTAVSRAAQVIDVSRYQRSQMWLDWNAFDEWLG
jgi:hypothetical protein